MDEYFFRSPSLALSLSLSCLCLSVFVRFSSQFFFPHLLEFLFFASLMRASIGELFSHFYFVFFPLDAKFFLDPFLCFCGSKASGHTSFLLLPFCVCVCVCGQEFLFCSSDAASFSSIFLFQVLKLCCRFQMDSCGSRISPSVESPGEVWLEVLVCM